MRVESVFRYPFKHRVAGTWVNGHQRYDGQRVIDGPYGQALAYQRLCQNWRIGEEMRRKIAPVWLTGAGRLGIVNSPLMMAALFYFIAPSQSLSRINDT